MKGIRRGMLSALVAVVLAAGIARGAVPKTTGDGTVFDLKVSVSGNPITEPQRDQYERVIEAFADGVYESTNGAHKIGRVEMFTRGRFQAQADIVWRQKGHPTADLNGYGRVVDGDIVRTGPGQIFMNDIFENGRHLGGGVFEDVGLLDEPEGAGYLLAHEWAHFAYGLYEEYELEKRFLGTVVTHFDGIGGDSILANPFAAAGWEEDDDLLHSLNFSTGVHYAGPEAAETWQYTEHVASGWETLARPVNDDPREIFYLLRPQRIRWPDLPARAPTPGALAPFDLPGTARSELSIIWPQDELAVMIVIDRSGSMAGAPLANAKVAARFLVDSAELDTISLGIVSFSDDVSVDQPLTPLTSNAVRDEIKLAISGIQSGGATAIGDAATAALGELLANTGPDDNRVVFLLSDGESNSGVEPLSVISSYQDEGTPLYTFAYGNEADQETLRQMAVETGGRYYFSPTNASDITAAFADALRDVLARLNLIDGIAPATTDQPLEASFATGSGLVGLEVTLSYAGQQGDAAPRLVSPSGTVYEPDSCISASGELICVFRIGGGDFEEGAWTIRVESLGPDLVVRYAGYGIPSETASSYVLAGSAGGDLLQYPAPFVVSARLIDQLPLTDIDTRVVFTTPSGTRAFLPVNDDGREPDAIAGDGVYTGLVPYNANGVWNVSVTAEAEAGVARFTDTGLMDSPAVNGGQAPRGVPDPITETVTRSTAFQVTIEGYRSDDHGNVPSQATPLPSDNTDVDGTIDRPGDVDVFSIELPQGSPSPVLQVVRVHGLSAAMKPDVRLIASDRQTVLSQQVVDDPRRDSDYVVIPLIGEAGQVFYVSVRHTQPVDLGNFFVSTGPILPAEAGRVALTSLLCIDQWSLKLKPGSPERGSVSMSGTIADPDRDFDPLVHGLSFVFNGTAMIELDPARFIVGRNGKLSYKTDSIRAQIVVNEKGTSRSSFRIAASGDFTSLQGDRFVMVTMLSGGLADGVVFAPQLSGTGGDRGAKYQGRRLPPTSEEFLVGSMRIKRRLTDGGRDSLKMTGKIAGSPSLSPPRVTFILNLGWDAVVIQPNQWTFKGNALQASGAFGTGGTWTVKLDRTRGTFSLQGRNMTIDSTSAQQTVGLAFGFMDRFAIVNGAAQTKKGQWQFRY